MHTLFITVKKKEKKKKSRKRELINVDAEPKRSHGVSDFQSSAPTFKKKYIYIYTQITIFTKNSKTHKMI